MIMAADPPDKYLAGRDIAAETPVSDSHVLSREMLRDLLSDFSSSFTITMVLQMESA